MAESTDQEKLLKRINELAHKNKKEGLTEAETKEREKLRKEYLKNFREAMRSNIEMMRIFDDNGKEVTPEKVREIQRKKGLRDD
ncbi:DUF896 domain-containing protein [Limosilactobacillus vaginalis]|jgi:uncharacterized protein YnzC (UPF0291/DUF896 family)|uniref:UPF0291 protein L2504_00845 n=1 Tax=Limosilactobacillus vaginalis TaxID=1633 RepID=A0ABT4K4X2_9LACO|nr:MULTISPECIES: DUF896 domain-containing protein [Limosilactobacillus]MBD8087132.1 DUF896 domain-containing protein [Limosilactobacillus portuensis]MCZ3745848.1 DUF896 domain-containing protein [Limosilactobacillus vaginalis]MCZ3750829.1 DUF896 domain-containing protein [Limosilactobacillus vaginalis]MCZ3752665.1 DUF896 domain-containing protein [Limosilactobacillus vaginalis]MCZ3754279.1 DUF896 domain-containing protein [Limosilactobacillus vaginalis]